MIQIANKHSDHINYYVETARINGAKGFYLHKYVVIEDYFGEWKPAFCDVRGIFEDKAAFMAEFLKYHNMLCCEQITMQHLTFTQSETEYPQWGSNIDQEYALAFAETIIKNERLVDDIFCTSYKKS